MLSSKTPHRRKNTVYILPSRIGLAFVALIVGTYVTGLVVGMNTIIFLSFCMAAFFGIGLFQTNRNVTDLVVSVGDISPVSAGEPGRLVLSVTNRGTEPRFSIYAQLNIGTMQGVGSVDAVLPKETRTVEVLVPPMARSIYAIKDLRLYTVFPLGLFYVWMPVPWTGEWVVHPQPKGDTDLPTDPGLEHEWLRHSRLQGVEFYEHRPYRLGEPLNHVDWKAKARGLPLLLKTGEESEAEGWVLRWQDLDSLAPEERLSQLAQWVRQCETVGQPFALVLPALYVPMERTPRHIRRCLRELARYPASHDAE